MSDPNEASFIAQAMKDSIRNQQEIEDAYYARMRAYDHALMLERMTPEQYACFTGDYSGLPKPKQSDWDDKLTDVELDRRSNRKNANQRT